MHMYLIDEAAINKEHTGPTELLHVWLHLNTTWDDPSWQVVIHNRNLCKESAARQFPMKNFNLIINETTCFLFCQHFCMVGCNDITASGTDCNLDKDERHSATVSLPMFWFQAI